LYCYRLLVLAMEGPDDCAPIEHVAEDDSEAGSWHNPGEEVSHIGPLPPSAVDLQDVAEDRRPSNRSLVSSSSGTDVSPVDWVPSFNKASRTLTSLTHALREDSDPDSGEVHQESLVVDAAPVARKQVVVENQSLLPTDDDFDVQQAPPPLLPPLPPPDRNRPASAIDGSSATASEVGKTLAPAPSAPSRPTSAAEPSMGQRTDLFMKICEVAIEAQTHNNTLVMSFLDDLKFHLKQREDEMASARLMVQQRDDKIKHLRDAAKKREDKMGQSRKLAQQAGEDINDSRNLMLQLVMEVTQAQALEAKKKALTPPAPPPPPPNEKEVTEDASANPFLAAVLRQRDIEIAQMEADLENLRATASSVDADCVANMVEKQAAQEDQIRELQEQLARKDDIVAQMKCQIDSLSKTGTTLAGSFQTQDGSANDALDFSHSNLLELSDDEAPQAA